MLLSSSVYWANHWAHRRRCGGSVKGVEAGLVEAGRAAPSLETCSGCPSPDAVWVSAELHPLNPGPPPFLGINAKGCVSGPPALSPTWSLTQTHCWFSSVPLRLNSWDVSWEGVSCGGKRLAQAGEEVLCHPGRLAYGGNRARVLWPKHFVFLFRCFLHTLLG